MLSGLFQIRFMFFLGSLAVYWYLSCIKQIRILYGGNFQAANSGTSGKSQKNGNALCEVCNKPANFLCRFLSLCLISLLVVLFDLSIFLISLIVVPFNLSMYSVSQWVWACVLLHNNLSGIQNAKILFTPFQPCNQSRIRDLFVIFSNYVVQPN